MMYMKIVFSNCVIPVLITKFLMAASKRERRKISKGIDGRKRRVERKGGRRDCRKA